jgi:hypothetical protein
MTIGHEPELHDSIKETFAGMAHFAGSGPAGFRCRECEHWATHHLSKPCRKFKRLTGRKARPVPGAAAACKYFSEHKPQETDMKVSELFPSPFFKHADLGGKPITLVISYAEEKEVGRNNELRPVLFFEGERRGMVLNKHNARFLAAMLGDDSEGWAKKRVTLYPTQVDFAGVPTNTIRLRIPTGAAAPIGETENPAGF